MHKSKYFNEGYTFFCIKSTYIIFAYYHLLYGYANICESTGLMPVFYLFCTLGSSHQGLGQILLESMYKFADSSNRKAENVSRNVVGGACYSAVNVADLHLFPSDCKCVDQEISAHIEGIKTLLLIALHQSS